jgi:hypothetical protein
MNTNLTKRNFVKLSRMVAVGTTAASLQLVGTLPVSATPAL